MSLVYPLRFNCDRFCGNSISFNTVRIRLDQVMARAACASEWEEDVSSEQERSSRRPQGSRSWILWALCFRQATSSSILKGSAFNKGNAWLYPWWLLGSLLCSFSRRLEVLSFYDRWLLKDDLGIHDETQEWGIQSLQGMEGTGGKSVREEDQAPSYWHWSGVLFYRIQWVL